MEDTNIFFVGLFGGLDEINVLVQCVVWIKYSILVEPEFCRKLLSESCYIQEYWRNP